MLDSSTLLYFCFILTHVPTSCKTLSDNRSDNTQILSMKMARSNPRRDTCILLVAASQTAQHSPSGSTYKQIWYALSATSPSQPFPHQAALKPKALSKRPVSQQTSLSNQLSRLQGTFTVMAYGSGPPKTPHVFQILGEKISEVVRIV